MSTGPSVSTAASSEDEKKEHRLVDVMFLCDEWKSSKGGLSTFNREFAINLAETTTGSMKIHCYVSKSDDRDREDAKQHGVNLVTARSVPGSSDPFECLKFPPSELPNPQLVIGHGRKLGSPAYSLMQYTKCKWIQFVHVYCEDLGKYKKTTAVATDTIEENEKKHKMEIDLCKVADAVVAVGSRLQQKYSRSLPNVKVEIITPGIFEKFSSESQFAIHRSDVKNFNVFLFGRATFEDLSLKGYDIVANAIGSLGKRFELKFVGSSPGEHQKVEQWFLDNTRINRNQLTIRGYCSDPEELRTMFYQSDLVALPSRTDGFGLVALEAVSAGIPILVSGESGIAEALREVKGGKTVIVELDEDTDEWARRISKMAKKSAEEREAKARRLRKNYRKVYSWRVECEKFKGMIAKVMENANDDEIDVGVEVEDLKPAKSKNQTTTSSMESAECQMDELLKSSAESTMVGSVSHPGTESLPEIREKFFYLVGKRYLQTMKPQSKKEYDEFIDYLQKLGAIMTRVRRGSLVITVKCESLQILEDLWKDYSSGHLGEVVQNCFVTEKILKELNLAELRLKTTIDTEDYNACKVYFEKVAHREQEELLDLKLQRMKGIPPLTAIPTTGHEEELEEPTEKIGNWEEPEDPPVKFRRMEGFSPFHEMSTIGQEKGGEELEETLKATWPLLGPSTSDLKEELEELRLKPQGMEGTSLSTKLSTVGHGKELEGKLKTMKLQEEKSILPLFEEEPEGLLMKLQRRKGSSPSVVLPPAGQKKELEERQKTMKIQGEKGSLPSPPLPTTDLEEKLEEVCVELMRLRKEGTLVVPESSTSYLVKKLAELRMELIRVRMEGTLPPPELFTAKLEKELKVLHAKLPRQSWEDSRLLISTFNRDVKELLRKLQEKRMEALENTMYPIIRSGLAKFDVSLPEELQSYVSYLFNESAKLGLRKRALHSLNAVEELQEAVDEYELKTFLSIHIREGAWQVALLFMDELSYNKLPWDWFFDAWYRWEEEEEIIGLSLYSSTSGILKAWPTEYDPDLVTLCKAITDRDWKVTGLILSCSRISEEGLKNLCTALTQGELYCLTLYRNGLQSQRLEHLCEVLISRDCNLTSLNVSGNWLGDEGIMCLCNVLTSVDCKLTSLNVSDSRLGDEEIMQLFTVLTSSNCTLTRLNVSLNRAGDRAVKDFARALTNKNCALTSLDISCNQIRDEGIKYLCKASTDPNCKLRSLDLRWNGKVTDAGKQCLSEAITGTDWEVRGGLTLSRSIKSEA
ncbi:uncharacterized protein LOC111341950 isoform X6 [Stylophora pistillata]|uniref:uncharacterized protein LOC111341950 isoform X6 n=1 Tax=Stylophora pistillata TaxID=50429 RepID=UPI000C042799|nr:uncharacterized protein LOC111341950 isoform X6 [Stylophora pistillata]